MKHTYQTKGTCARKIQLEIDENGTVHNVVFEGGCMGNTQGVAALVEGMQADDVIEKCRNIQCGFRGTSCPDQLAAALEQALSNG